MTQPINADIRINNIFRMHNCKFSCVFISDNIIPKLDEIAHMGIADYCDIRHDAFNMLAGSNDYSNNSNNKNNFIVIYCIFVSLQRN